MKLIGDVADEKIEAIASLWSNKDFQTLLDLMRARRNQLALNCLSRDIDSEQGRKEIQEMQIEASLITNLINLAKDAVEKTESKEKLKS